MDIITVLVTVGPCASCAEARRLVRMEAVKVNEEPVMDITTEVPEGSTVQVCRREKFVVPQNG